MCPSSRCQQPQREDGEKLGNISEDQFCCKYTDLLPLFLGFPDLSWCLDDLDRGICSRALLPDHHPSQEDVPSEAGEWMGGLQQENDPYRYICLSSVGETGIKLEMASANSVPDGCNGISCVGCGTEV